MSSSSLLSHVRRLQSRNVDQYVDVCDKVMLESRSENAFAARRIACWISDKMASNQDDQSGDVEPFPLVVACYNTSSGQSQARRPALITLSETQSDELRSAIETQARS